MKQEEALGHLREMIWALQRHRSIVMETLGPSLDHSPDELCLTKELAAKMWPWVFGEKCPLPVLTKIIDDAETGGSLDPMDYYNMMFILDRFIPEVKVGIHAWRGTWTIPEGPPSVSVLSGWEE